MNASNALLRFEFGLAAGVVALRLAHPVAQMLMHETGLIPARARRHPRR